MIEIIGWIITGWIAFCLASCVCMFFYGRHNNTLENEYLYDPFMDVDDENIRN